MTTPQMDASAWDQLDQLDRPTSPRRLRSGSAVALIGLGAVLNLGWIGLMIFALAKLALP
ncbi:hypothetical protein [Bosea lathyri]|jgi:hypothetical protein|uniref:Uncharacterized protein n=1 Tax=Bosea lathyri TaxID=1036778 RepID=A0A1H6BFV3_9HYPH|nr:hypothetical protein [Bosea lathyri]SEG59658.1 hypothetical protein SAMN04488115_107209 [Bosea lathyri]